MAGSDSGASSTASNAGSYRSVRVHRNGDVTDSSSAVPDDAPEPHRDSLAGVYDQAHDRFYSITVSSSGSEYQARRWDQRAAKWIKDHKDGVGRALVDVAPSLIQGAANFAPAGLARTAVKTVGLGSQVALTAYDAYQLYQQDRADPMRVTSLGGRAVSTGLNLYNALGPQGTATAVAGGAANWAAGAATVTKAVADAQTPTLPLYQQRANIPLQDLPARLQPPPPGTPTTVSSIDSFRTAPSAPGDGPAVPLPRLTSRPVGEFGPPGGRDTREDRRPPAQGTARTSATHRTVHTPPAQRGGSGPSM